MAIIENFKPIISENPVGQIWKYLRFFRDVSFVSNKIYEIHEIPAEKHRNNVEKQARQIGYCLRQAEEYFQASAHVGLPTRPLLLYYGAVSLSRALVLLRGNGEYSFDRLPPKHRHHGLELRFPQDTDVEAFWEMLQCKCYGDTQELCGHFPLFYKVLISCVIQVPAKTKDFHVGKTSIVAINDQYMRYVRLQECADLLPRESLTQKTFNVLSLLKTLPDMYSDLIELDIVPDLCEGSLEVEFEDFDRDDGAFREKYFIKIHKCTAEQKRTLLDFYKQNPDIQLINSFDSGMILEFVRLSSDTDESPYFFPDIVDNVNGHKFYLVKPEDYISEPAAHLVILYCLGMLCRYHPHVWIKAIDENVQIAELTDSFLNIVYRKFPNLILDQLTGIHHARLLIDM